MNNRLFGLIAVHGELERIEKANQIFFHSYAILTFFVPFWLVTFKGEGSTFFRILWQVTFGLLIISIFWIGKAAYRLYLWAIPMLALTTSGMSILILRPKSGDSSLPITLITLAVVLYTSSTLPRKHTYFWIGIALLCEAIVLKYGGAWFAFGGAIIHGIPIVIIFHATVGVLVYEALHRSRTQALLLDQALSELVALRSKIEFVTERERDRRTRLQRIHGNVLNALIGLANWTGPITSTLLKNFGSGLSGALDIKQSEGSSLGQLSENILRRIDTRDFKVRYLSTADIVVTQKNATAISAVIEECVNNAIRHSGGTTIGIGWRISDHGEVELWVQDDGRGFPSDFEARLGWNAIILPNVKELDGRYTIEAHNPSGTRITFTFLNFNFMSAEFGAIQSLRHTFEAQDTYRDNALGWASIVTAYILLLLSPIYILSFGDWQRPALLSLILFIYLSILLRFPRLQTLATFTGGILLACGLLLVSEQNVSGCTNTSSLQWFVNIGGTIFLASVYRFSTRAFLLQFPLFVFTAIYVGLHIDIHCRQVISVPLFGAGIYGIAAVVHSIANKRRRRVGEDTLTQFKEIEELESKRLEQRVRDETRWKELLLQTQDIFSELKEGDLLSPELRRSATLQDARLRAHLQIESMNHPRLFSVVARLIDRISQVNLIPTVQIGSFVDEEIDASEEDFQGPAEIIDCLERDLIKFKERALLEIERDTKNDFIARISGKTFQDLNFDFTIRNWHYKSFSDSHQGVIEISVTTPNQ